MNNNDEVVKLIHQKIEPIRDAIIRFEAEQNFIKQNLDTLEDRLNETLEQSTKQYEKLEVKLDNLSKQLSKILWISTGIGSTIVTLWIFGKDIANILVKIFL